MTRDVMLAELVADFEASQPTPQARQAAYLKLMLDGFDDGMLAILCQGIDPTREEMENKNEAV